MCASRSIAESNKVYAKKKRAKREAFWFWLNIHNGFLTLSLSLVPPPNHPDEEPNESIQIAARRAGALYSVFGEAK